MNRSTPIAAVVLLAVIVIGLAAGTSAFTPVKYGTVEVVTKFGGLTGRVLTEGLSWKTPFIEGTDKFVTLVQSYETSARPDSSLADFTDSPVSAQTVDGQQISISYTVLFRVAPDDVIDVLRHIGRMGEVVENVVKANSRSLSRLHAQGFDAEDLYSGAGIFEYQATVEDALRRQLEAAGVTMPPDGFKLRKIEFDSDYVQAIENQQIAQEKIRTAEFDAEAAEWRKEGAIRLSEGDKQREILLAEADAQRTRLSAEANADARKLSAAAEAYAIEQQGAALRRYPEVIQWTFVQNLDVEWGILPDTGVTPLLPVPLGD